MLHGLDDIRWADLEHAYGPAEDVPELLRELLHPDEKVRHNAMQALYGNVYHQGTRYPATPRVIPFLIEMCQSPATPDRGHLLHFWGSLITGFFSVQERPIWGDGVRIHEWDAVADSDPEDPYTQALHDIYLESLKGLDLLADLLWDGDQSVRGGAAWVLACLPTVAAQTAPKLEARLSEEGSGWVRTAIAFALGELGAAGRLRRLLADDPFPAARCMAACQLARVAPGDDLVEPLLHFLSEPIEAYEDVPGAGGRSTGDAAWAISQLAPEVRRRAIPALCDRLRAARSFDTMPLATALLEAAFSPRKEPLVELDALQRQVLACMVDTEELWSIGNLTWTFEHYGLKQDRRACAELVGVKVADDEALKSLSIGASFAQIGFLEEARNHITKALDLDPSVFERTPGPDECWLLCAKAFAETDPRRALDAYRNATSLNPAIARRVEPTWHLADVLSREESP